MQFKSLLDHLLAPTIKVGDAIQLIKNSGITTTQKSRVIYQLIVQMKLKLII